MLHGAVRAAECAAEQRKFAPMHDRLYAEQRTWKRGEPEPDFARAAANERAMRLDIRATPSFLIDGRQAESAMPLPQSRQLLDPLAC